MSDEKRAAGAWMPDEHAMDLIDAAARELMPFCVQATAKHTLALQGSAPQVELNPEAAAVLAFRLAGAWGRQRDLERAALAKARQERLAAERALGLSPNGRPDRPSMRITPLPPEAGPS